MTVQFNPPAVIKKLGDENGKNSDMHAKMARCIDKDIRTSFISMGCFINELIQNAEDKAAKPFAEISFVLNKGELIVTHKGKPFTEADVKGICDFANADENLKSEEKDKTGYKDIGFKSVFKVAHRVDICSGACRFHFDEKNERWKRKEGENPYPWQIAPLWTEESQLSPEAKKCAADQEQTTFIFQLRDPAVVEQELRKYIENPEDILFLSKIRKVSFSINGQQFAIANRDHTISVNDQPKSRWMRFDEKIDIKDNRELLAFLKTLKPNECPKRLRDAEDVTLSFCYQIQDDQFVQGRDNRVYCTLPTGVKPRFPFSVNGPFSLNPSREALLVHKLNIFLINSVARLNFAHFKHFLAQKNKTAFRALAPAEMAGVDDALAKTFQERMKNLVETEAFLPPQSGKRLLRLNEAKVDPTGFYRMVDKEKLTLDGTENVIHPAIEPKEILQRFPEITKITLNEIIEKLPDIMQKHRNARTCALILNFFSTIFKSGKKYDPAHLELFKKQEFVLTANGKLVSLEKVLLPLESKVALPACLPLHLIHPDILNPELCNWLEKIDVEHLTAQAIVELYSENPDHATLKTKKDNLDVFKILLYFFKERLIKEGHLRSLKGILVYSMADTVRPSNQIYFSAQYLPKFQLQEHLPGQRQLFVSEDYRGQGEDFKVWKSFFLHLGVIENCEFAFPKTISVDDVQNIPECYINEYLEHVFRGGNPQRPAKTAKRIQDPNDNIFPFACFPFIRWIRESPSFRQYFWGQLLANQERILQNYSTTTYHAYKVTGGEKEQDETYLQYVFLNQKLVSDRRGDFHTSKFLYAPSMERTTGALFPTAVLPVALSPQLEQFLGFKTTIQVDHCFSLLEALQAPGAYQHDSYQLVMRHLLANMRNEKLKVAILKLQWKFQAVNNEWHPITALQLWAFPNSLPPHDSPHWIKPILDSEMTEFCAFFGRESVSECKDRSLFNQARKSEDLRLFLWQKIPVIAYHWARYRSFERDPSYYVNFLVTGLSMLNFMLISGESEADDETSTDGIQMTRIDDSLYYLPDWEAHKDSLGDIMGKYLKFEGYDIAILKNALKWNKPYREKEQKKLNEFIEACEKLTKREAEGAKPPAPPVLTPPAAKGPAISPDEPAGTPSSDPSQEDESLSDSPPPEQNTPKKGPKEPWSPLSPPDKPNESPIQDEPAPKTGWQPTATPGGHDNKGKSRSKVGKGSDGEDGGNGLTNIDKKRIGQWAEEHVLMKRIEKYLKKYENDSPTVEDLQNGIRRITVQAKKIAIDLLWHNDPRLRPEGQKDNELWDSGQHFDIQLTKREEGKAEKLKRLEAKGTTGKQVHFILQGQEWRTLQLEPSKYRIYVVTQVGTDSAEVTRFKNLLKALEENRLVPISPTEFRV